MHMQTTLLAVIIDGRWYPGIGDPTVKAWFIVATYLAGAVLSGLCWTKRNQLVGPSLVRRFGAYWLVLAVTLLLLGINKQLDLQSLVHVMGRHLAKEQGWYDQRRIVQTDFIAGIVLLGVGSCLFGFWMMRGLLTRLWLSLVGLVFLVVFVITRAASFHHFDLLLSKQVVQGFNLNFVLEWTGIALVVANAGGLLARRSTAG